MDPSDVSFLFQGDRNLDLVSKYWYDPVYLISPYQNSLKDLFALKDRDRITELAMNAYSQEGNFIFGDGYEMLSPAVRVTICMMAKADRVFILGMNTGIFNNDVSSAPLRDLIRRLMGLIISADQDLMSDNMETVRGQFEEIQKLNNQLVNMQRQLKKSNAKLNHLNADLNNRLVKDELTGLVSRYQYREEIERAIAKERDKFGIFTFLDLDRFKKINDTFGHRTGDDYLKEFARRLKELPFENYIAMRISGDEFGLYIHGYHNVSEKEYRKVWEKIEEYVLRKPISFKFQKLKVLCSGGMAVYGKHTKDFFDLIEYADFAMYEAKNSKTDPFKSFNKQRYLKRKYPV